MKITTTSVQKQGIKQLVSSIFKQNDKPYELTDGQCDVFRAITDPQYKWVWISAPTRYGKSETIALAAIYLAVFHNLKVPIVGGSEDKAKKIMEYIVAHLGDHPSLYKGLINMDVSDVDRLKVQMSKSALRWASGGWVYITSIDSRSISREGEGVVGEGGDVVILEEAGLIKHREQFSKVVRMPEGNDWGKMVMTGNCIEKSVFEDAYNDPEYGKVRITLDQAIEEGRVNESRLEQQKKQTTTRDWKRYYLVEFPAQNEFTYFKPKKYEILPNNLKYYGAVDLALGESKKGSLVGIVVVGVDDKGVIYEIESIGESLKPDDTMRTIFNLPYKFERFEVEAVQFQKYFLQQIEERSRKEGKYIPFQGMQQKRKKEERIESLEPYINTNQILFKGDNMLWEHMSEYPNGEYLDVLDALEMATRSIFNSSFDFSFV